MKASVTDFSICCYFDEGNILVLDVKDLKITTGPPQTLIYNKTSEGKFVRMFSQ